MSDQTGKIAAGTPLFTGDRVSYVDSENEGPNGGPRVFIGAPDYRVFLWGVEITADVFSVSIKNGLNENLSTCQINIVNDNEKYTTPPGLNRIRSMGPNSAGGFSVQPDEWSDADPGDLVLSSKGTNTQTEPVDTRELARLKIERFRKARNKFLNVPIEKIITKFPNGDIFPLVPGMPIIQAPDPIRVFLKNPWNLASTSVGSEGSSSEEWYYGFTGFVAACTEEFDGKTNRSILRVYCEEIRRFLRYMLTTTNTETVSLDDPSGISPNLNTSGEKFKITDSPGFTRLISANQSIESNMSLPQAYKFVFFGDTTEAKANEQEQTMNRISGVPGFSSERLREETLPLKRGDLEKAMSSRLDSMYPQLSEEDVKKEGAKFEFDEQTLWIILPDPAGWSHDEARWPFSWGFRADYISEFRSRFDILDEFTKRIDAIWYSTPKGDVVLEFPQYDQIPQLHEEPWRSILQIQNEWVGYSLTDDDRNIRTLTLSPRSPIAGFDLSKSAPYVAFGVQSDPVMQARYGYRIQNFPRPFAHDSNAAIGDEKAQASMLQALANSDSNRLEGLECLPNFRAPVARPFYFKYRNIIAFCTRIQHQVVWGQDARTIFELHYLRPFDTKRNDWVRLSQDYGWNWTGIKKDATLNQEQAHGADLAPVPTKAASSAQVKSTADAIKNAPEGTYTAAQRKRAEALAAAGDKALAAGNTEKYRKITEKLDAIVSDTRK